MTKSIQFFWAVTALTVVGGCNPSGESDAFNSQGGTETGDSATASSEDGTSAATSGNGPSGPSAGAR